MGATDARVAVHTDGFAVGCGLLAVSDKEFSAMAVTGTGKKRLTKLAILLVTALLMLSVYKAYDNKKSFDIISVRYAKTEAAGWHGRETNETEFEGVALPYYKDDGYFRVHFTTNKEILKLRVLADDCLEEAYLDGEKIHENTGGCLYNPGGIYLDLNPPPWRGHTLAVRVRNTRGLTLFSVAYEQNGMKWKILAITSLVFLMLLLYGFFAKGKSLPVPSLKNAPITYILALFLSTRIVLTIIGMFSRRILGRVNFTWVYSQQLWLDVWSVWDSGWYMEIAKNLYPASVVGNIHPSYAFFPVYPLLMRVIGDAIGGYYIAGVVISNLSLILTCVFLYKLVRIGHDEKTALKSIKYLFLFPSAFILSAVFSESLFLLFIVACFYYSRANKWHWCGLTGFLAALTRPLGVVVFLPIAYEHLKSKKFRLKKIKPDVLFLLLIPVGLLTLAAYDYYLTGDYLAFVHIGQYKWRHRMTNPLSVLERNLETTNANHFFSAAFTVAALVILTLGIRKIGFSYWLLGFFLIVIPLASGGKLIQGMLRFILPVFPLYILFAKVGRNDKLDQLITVVLALLQGFLMVFWSVGYHLII